MKPIRLLAVGDLMLGDHPLYVGLGTRSKRTKTKKSYFRFVERYMKDADIVFANLECTMASNFTRGYISGQMVCDENIINDLKTAGFTVLNVANNHCMQHGYQQWEETYKEIEKKGIKTIGQRDCEPYVIRTKGLKILFLSMSNRPEQYLPEQQYYETRIDAIKEQIEFFKDEIDCIVLSIHWGFEYMKYPSTEQIKLAHDLIDCGVDIILGHHSHTFQAVEYYNGAIIAYGLGNFVSEMCQRDSKMTGIVELIVKGKRNIDYVIHPCIIDTNYSPHLVNEESQAADNIRYVQELFRKNYYTPKDIYKQQILYTQSQYRREFRRFFACNFYKYPPYVLYRMVYEALIRLLRRTLP